MDSETEKLTVELAAWGVDAGDSVHRIERASHLAQEGMTAKDLRRAAERLRGEVFLWPKQGDVPEQFARLLTRELDRWLGRQRRLRSEVPG